MTHGRERFLVLAQRRQEQAENCLRLIGNLSAPNYDWTPEEVDAIFGNIRYAVDQAESRFRRNRSRV